MRNRNALEFLGIWETLHNTSFNPLRLAEHEIRYAGHLAVRHEGEMEAISTRLSEHLHECAVVLRWRREALGQR